jgi:hypothetical protein
LARGTLYIDPDDYLDREVVVKMTVGQVQAVLRALDADVLWQAAEREAHRFLVQNVSNAGPRTDEEIDAESPLINTGLTIGSYLFYAVANLHLGLKIDRAALEPA